MNPVTSSRVRLAWTEAARQLGFEFVAPFAIETEGKKVKYLGLVPKFGGPKGTALIFEGRSGSARERAVAEANGYGWSVMNRGSYHEFERTFFESVLRDWEWFGSPSQRPEFLQKAHPLSGRAGL